MSELKPTLENLMDPYVLQLIQALAERDDEIERLTDEKQANAQIQWKAACEVYRAENERLTAESKADKIRLADMEATCEFLHETEADNERLTAKIDELDVWDEGQELKIEALEKDLAQARAGCYACEPVATENERLREVIKCKDDALAAAMQALAATERGHKLIRPMEDAS